MHFRHQKWTIAKWQSLEDRINPKPQYQRGDVWDDAKRSLLIDSVLGGYDIPKIYLRRTKRTGAYEYDVADGQQRLKAIWRFMSGNLQLTGMSPSYQGLNGKTFADLPEECKRRVREYCIIASIVYDASNDEIRELFRRLQLGVRLTPAELRNSMASAIGNEIRAMAINSHFFQHSPFPVERFKADDLIAHAFAVVIFGLGCDIKAPDLKKMYAAYARRGAPLNVAKRVHEILAFMHKMQAHIPKCIKTKWGFVDLVGVLKDEDLGALNLDAFTDAYNQWERERLAATANTEALASAAPGTRRKNLFIYISAFQKEGATKRNLLARNRVLTEVLLGRLP